MTQEEKDLLFKDLSARLLYNVKGNYQNSDDKLLRSITIVYNYLKPNGMVMTGDIKPYLFPLSSMTEEQSKIYHELIGGMFGTSALINFEVLENFFHKNHLDYKGLIEKNLAIDATNKNIY